MRTPWQQQPPPQQQQRAWHNGCVDYIPSELRSKLAHAEAAVLAGKPVLLLFGTCLLAELHKWRCSVINACMLLLLNCWCCWPWHVCAVCAGVWMPYIAFSNLKWLPQVSLFAISTVAAIVHLGYIRTYLCCPMLPSGACHMRASMLAAYACAAHLQGSLCSVLQAIG